MSAIAKQIEVKERPIIFSSAMVNAILEGRKTQTRRVVKPQPLDSWMLHRNTDWSEYYQRTRFGLKKHLWIAHPTENKEIVCPKGVPGDRLWVKETFGIPAAPYEKRTKELVVYRADQSPALREANKYFWRNVRNMPRWASRIALSITNIRVERLQRISEADAIAEGVRQLRDGSRTFAGREGPGNLVTPWPTAKEAFADGWELINGKQSWADNPWVWVIEFKRFS